jgi:alpha-galactosidase/6-phospho-beta-glucosidase family protein
MGFMRNFGKKARAKNEVMPEPDLDVDEDEEGLSITRLAIQDIESKRRQKLLEIGETVYQMVKNEALDEEKLKVECDQIVQLAETLNFLREQERARSQENEGAEETARRLCPKCERGMRQADVYCYHCGIKLPPMGLKNKQ